MCVILSTVIVFCRAIIIVYLHNVSLVYTVRIQERVIVLRKLNSVENM
jgi:hypothetical protein